MDPKENVIVVGPKKGACYVCSADLIKSPSIQVHVPIPLVKMKRVIGRACIPCAKEFLALVSLRIAQAERGEFHE